MILRRDLLTVLGIATGSLFVPNIARGVIDTNGVDNKQGKSSKVAILDYDGTISDLNIEG